MTARRNPSAGFGLLMALAAALPAAAQTPASPDGAALFARHCAACHQADGRGTVGLAPSLHGPHWERLGADRAYLPTVLLKGLSGPIRVNGQAFVGSMPPFAATLDDDSLAALASHLAGLQGTTDRPAFRAAEIAAVRQGAGDPARTRALRQQLLQE